MDGNDGGRRLRALDGMRGLAATGVVMLHVWMYDFGDAHRPPKRLGDYVAGELRLGVILFFVLSGYLLYRPWIAAALDRRVRPRVGTYALRRAARIVPAYWLALAGAFALTAAIDHPLARDAGQLWTFALFGQNYVSGLAHGIDPPMWSLGVEVSFYVALPLIGFLTLAIGADRRVQLALCAVLVALGVAANAIAHAQGWEKTVTTSLPFFLPYFAIGMAVAAGLHRRAWSWRAGAVAVAAGCALVVANSVWHAHHELPLRFVLRDVPAGIGFGLVVAALVAAPLRTRLLTCRPVQLLGTLSYGIYLWHYPALLFLRDAGWWSDRLAVAFAETLALALAAAAVSWLAVERPALRLAHRRRLSAAR